MTNRQNNDDNKPLSIAQEILSELLPEEKMNKKEEQPTEKKQNKAEKAAPVIDAKPKDSLAETIVLVEDEEPEEDSTDDFVIPMATVITEEVLNVESEVKDAPSHETEEKFETETADGEKVEAPVISEIPEERPSEPEQILEYALPPTREEKRAGVLQTKVMSSEETDSKEEPMRPHDHALPPTRAEKRAGVLHTKVMSSEETDSKEESVRPHDHALPPTREEKRANASGTKVMPSDRNDTDDFIFTKYKRTSPHSSEHESKSRKKTKKRFRDKPFWKKLLIILGSIFGTLLGIALALVIAFFVSSCIGKKQLTNYDNMNVTAPKVEGASISVSQGGRTVEYNGKNYKFNENMTTILCIGVDKHGLGTEDDVIGTGGQADALFLVAMDMKTGETDIIAIPRDIITDIEIKSAGGKYIGTEKQQICLSYAYGDGKHTSCQNTQTAVERLFFNLPIQSYFAIDIEAIGYLNDAIDGVTVTMKDDFFRSLHYGVQTRHYTGETVHLDGENAIRYVQQREVAYLESSTERLDRQMNYMNAFSKKAITMTKKDLGVPVDLFNIVKNNSATDLNVTKISALAEVVAKGISAPNFTKIPGELTSDGTYAVYNVDNEKFYEMFLETFYIPQS